ncbi:glycosyltransferase [Brevibacterium atlanticum]|uniref:glycosyltransferase n=1 Tax=Brevibacterium atlanticum TaxID=2697563 RepID=UPI001423E739|nr:glycosyltransferase [Brevibacterium atlanticum]
MSLNARPSREYHGSHPSSVETARPLGTDAVHVYNVLWGIPASMGGMTTAALRRIRSFQKYGRALSQTILTFDPRMDTDAIRAQLIAQGKISDDVELVNIWPELRARTESGLAALIGESLRAPVPPEVGEVENITAFYDVFRSPRTGAVIRRNYRRADGSLLLADIDDPTLGRRFVLHSPDGRPMTEWRRPRDFYNAWVSAVVTKEPAVVIVDEKKVSEFIHEISDRAFPLILFLHGTHLRHPWNGNHGQILARRLDTIRNLDRFDIVGVQTEQQAEAIRALGFPEVNIRLLTGELPESAMLSGAPRQLPLNSAVMIANLIKLKRIDHPIRAVAELRDRGIDVSLTVLGEGGDRQRLENLIDALDLGDRVELPGYVTDVSDRLQSASFSMLTSTSEGLPLSMMESMGAGCIPIVYDITYGPRDLIDHGHNGFITPWSDIDALADQIEAFLSLGAEHVNDMRKEARKTVERYLPEAAYGRWKDVLQEVEMAHQPEIRGTQSAPPIEAKKLTCEVIPQGCRIEIELERIQPEIAESLELVIAGRKLSTFFITSSVQTSTRRIGHRHFLTFDVDYAGFSESPEETFDVYLRRGHDLWTQKRRVQAPRRFRAVKTGRREWYSTKHGNLSVRPRS